MKNKNSNNKVDNKDNRCQSNLNMQLLGVIVNFEFLFTLFSGIIFFNLIMHALCMQYHAEFCLFFSSFFSTLFFSSVMSHSLANKADFSMDEYG